MPQHRQQQVESQWPSSGAHDTIAMVRQSAACCVGHCGAAWIAASKPPRPAATAAAAILVAVAPAPGAAMLCLQVAVAVDGAVAVGASSNGAIHKVPGRVGDAAVPGGGAYADSEVGGCGSTGELAALGLGLGGWWRGLQHLVDGRVPGPAAAAANAAGHAQECARWLATRLAFDFGAVCAIQATATSTLLFCLATRY